MLCFDNGVVWDIVLQFSELNLVYWVVELLGLLVGFLCSQGSVCDEWLVLGVDFDVKGCLCGQLVLFQVCVEGEGQCWMLGNFDLCLGDNKVQGSGVFDQCL